MITEDRLRSLLEETASPIDPPHDGAARVIEAAAPDPERVARRRPQLTLRRLSLVGAAAVLLVAGVMALTADESPQRNVTAAAGTETTAVDKLRQENQALRIPAPRLAVPSAAGVPEVTLDSAGTTAAAPDSAKVIKTGGLEIEVAEGRFADAMARITTTVVAAGGYVADTKTTESVDNPAGTITVRIPADRFEAVTADLRRLGTVRSADVSGRDVTAEYTDVQARLRTLNTTRTSLLDVLSKARAIGDILAVQDRLNAVQTEIEQLQGRQQVLDNQVALATIAVNLHEPGGANLLSGADRRSSWERAVDGFTSTWSKVLAHSGAALATVLVVGLFLALLAGLYRWARRVYARYAVATRP